MILPWYISLSHYSASYISFINLITSFLNQCVFFNALKWPRWEKHDDMDCLVQQWGPLQGGKASNLLLEAAAGWAWATGQFMTKGSEIEAISTERHVQTTRITSLHSTIGRSNLLNEFVYREYPMCIMIFCGAILDTLKITLTAWYWGWIS